MAIGCGSVVNSASGLHPEAVTEQHSRPSGVSFCGRCALQVTEVCSRLAGLIKCGAEFVQCLLHRSAEVITKSVSWLVENRFGLAKLVGLVIIPSQRLSKAKRDFRASMVLSACESNPSKVPKDPSKPYNRRVLIKCEDGYFMSAVICEPANWDKTKNNRCVLYHNPSTDIMGNCLLGDSGLLNTPGSLQQMRQCPVIIYDYRGSGINFPKSTFTRIINSATCETATRDGLTVLTHALKKYDKVESYGVAFGGAVAARSLARYLDTHKNFDVSRVSLVVHDSFTTIPRVFFPSVPTILADSLGWLVGAHMDATNPIQSVIDRKVQTTVLNNTADEVIDERVRMSGYIKSEIKSQPPSSVTVSEGEKKLGSSRAHGIFTSEGYTLLMNQNA